MAAKISETNEGVRVKFRTRHKSGHDQSCKTKNIYHSTFNRSEFYLRL